MEIFLRADTWLALLTLCFLEIVLGIDNIIFISIVSNKLPEAQRRRVRNAGLFLAMFVRIVFLVSIKWIMEFDTPLFTVADFLPPSMIKLLSFNGAHSFSGHDLILGVGGLFLIGKSTTEISHKMELDVRSEKTVKIKVPTMLGTVIQIVLLDIIFSIDSILTAIGIVDQIIIMILAVVISIVVMAFFSGAISKFIQQHPSLEVLALGFLILIGFVLFLEALEYPVPKAYVYFAVAFSLLIEMANIRLIKKQKFFPIVPKQQFPQLETNELAATAEEKYSDDPSYPIGKFVSKEKYTLTELREFVGQLQELPAKLEDAVKGLTDEKLDTPYREGGWTVRQVIHHISDSHMNAYIRVKWALTEDTPLIKAYDEKGWALTPETKLPIEMSMALLKTLHVKWTTILSLLEVDDLKKKYIHPDTNKHTQIDQMIALYAWHGEHHLAHILVLRKNKLW